MFRFFCPCGRNQSDDFFFNNTDKRLKRSVSVVEVTRTIKITQAVKIETPMIIDMDERAITPEPELTTEEICKKIIANPDEIDFLFKPKDNEKIETIEDNVEGYEPDTTFSLNNDEENNEEKTPKCILL